MASPIDVTIELARADDVPAMLALSNHAAIHTAANLATEPERLSDWVSAWEATRATYPWIVARESNGIAGFAKGSPHRTRGGYRHTAEVTVYVDASAHRRGVGTALYARLIPLLRAQGYVTLLAGIAQPNPASVRLHEAHGFVRCGTYHRAGWKLGAWHDVGYWELHLHPEGAPPPPLRDVASVWGDR